MKTFFLFFLAAVTATSCKKDAALWEIKNLNNNTISAFGHGGMGILYRYPMNSLESLNHVLALGADGTEFDLELSKDGQLVLYHDIYLENETNSKGKIREKNWSDIENTKYNLPYLDRAKLILTRHFFSHTGIDNQRIFTFDCKVEASDDPDYINGFADELYNIISQYHIENNAFIESYNIDFLKRLQNKDARLKLFIHCNSYSDGLYAAQYVHLYGLTLDRLKISKDEITEAHKNNLHITLFNMSSENANIKAIEMSPDFMQTDKIEHLLKVLKKK